MAVSMNLLPFLWRPFKRSPTISQISTLGCPGLVEPAVISQRNNNANSKNNNTNTNSNNSNNKNNIIIIIVTTKESCRIARPRAVRKRFPSSLALQVDRGPSI